MGFQDASDPPGFSCDFDPSNPDKRLCFSTTHGVLTAGYRCGSLILGGDRYYQRLIYHTDDDPTS
jgi:hypothetical protein